jgi:hypothetical protein
MYDSGRLIPRLILPRIDGLSKNAVIGTVIRDRRDDSSIGDLDMPELILLRRALETTLRDPQTHTQRHLYINKSERGYSLRGFEVSDLARSDAVIGTELPDQTALWRA